MLTHPGAASGWFLGVLHAWGEGYPGIRDRILTLSTCANEGQTTRWVVHARLNMIPARKAQLANGDEKCMDYVCSGDAADRFAAVP